jgi:hypothetical protein
VLNVIDSRQEYPQQMVRLALQTLGLHQEAANLHHVRYGVVTLSPDTAARLGLDTSKGRASYPMSGRQGIGIKVSDLLEQMEAAVEAVRPRKEGIASREVAAAAIRYSLLRFNLLTEIVLDLEQAAALHGNSGVYLMYQHARCAKLLQDGGWSASPGVAAPAVPAELLDRWPPTPTSWPPRPAASTRPRPCSSETCRRPCATSACGWWRSRERRWRTPWPPSACRRRTPCEASRGAWVPRE